MSNPVPSLVPSRPFLGRDGTGRVNFWMGRDGTGRVFGGTGRDGMPKFVEGWDGTGRNVKFWGGTKQIYFRWDRMEPKILKLSFEKDKSERFFQSLICVKKIR